MAAVIIPTSWILLPAVSVPMSVRLDSQQPSVQLSHCPHRARLPVPLGQGPELQRALYPLLQRFNIQLEPTDASCKA